jgi:hypothetical protein
MAKPELYVDFNEMLAPDLVLLSADDSKVAATGEPVLLRAGLRVAIFMDDFDDKGSRDDLVAFGLVVANTSAGGAQHVRWCCRIDGNGIRRRSEL